MLPVYSKVRAVGLAGLIASIIITALPFLGVEVSAEVAAAIVTVATFIAGFFKKEVAAFK